MIIKRERINKITTVCSLLIVCFLYCINPVMADEKDKSTGEGSALVFLLDVSGSMRTNDKDRRAIDSILRLIYSLPSGCKIGVIAYNDGVAYKSELTDFPQRSELVDGVSEILYRGYTDTGEGLHEAVELLKTYNSSKRNIFLFTDGEIDKSTPEETERSKEVFEAAIKEAAAHEIVIDVIGFGVGGGETKTEVFTAQEATGGLRFEIETDEQIAEAIDEISRVSGLVAKDATYAENMKQEEQTITVPLSYEGATEVRVILSSDKNFEVISIESEGEVTEERGSFYTAIVIKGGAVGDLSIRVKSETGNLIKTDVIPDYGLTQEQALSGGGGTPVETATVTAAPGKNSRMEEDRTLQSSGKEGFGAGNGLKWSRESFGYLLARRGIGIGVIITILTIVLVILVIRLLKKKKQAARILKLSIKGGKFGNKGYIICYSRFRLQQQGETSLQEIMVSSGMDDRVIGADGILFGIEKKGYLILIDDLVVEVKCRHGTIPSVYQKKLPLLYAAEIFVESTDDSLVIRRVVLEKMKKSGGREHL